MTSQFTDVKTEAGIGKIKPSPKRHAAQPPNQRTVTLRDSSSALNKVKPPEDTQIAQLSQYAHSKALLT